MIWTLGLFKLVPYFLIVYAFGTGSFCFTFENISTLNRMRKSILLQISLFSNLWKLALCGLFSVEVFVALGTSAVGKT